MDRGYQQEPSPHNQNHLVVEHDLLVLASMDILEIDEDILEIKVL